MDPSEHIGVTKAVKAPRNFDIFIPYINKVLINYVIFRGFFQVRLIMIHLVDFGWPVEYDSLTRFNID